MSKLKMANVGDWAKKTKARKEAVMKGSIQELSRLANLTREKGGRMPVITSTLRDSFITELNGQVVASGDPDLQSMVGLSGMKMGDKVHCGWTVVYAPRVNLGFFEADSLGREYNQSGAHFVEFATDQWQQIVDGEVAKAMKAAGK